MITRGLFIRSISKLEFENGIISMEFQATEINKGNMQQIFSEYGQSPYNLAMFLKPIFIENFKEPIEYIRIVEGKSKSPLMFTITTNNSSLTIGKVWFDKNSSIKYDDVVNFMFHINSKGGVKILLDGINYLMHGE